MSVVQAFWDGIWHDVALNISGEQYITLGLQLEVSGDELGVTLNKYPCHVALAAFDVLRRWGQRQADSSQRLSLLSTALRRCNMDYCAQLLDRR